MRFLIATTLLTAAALTAAAETDWTLTTADFQSRPVKVIALDGDGVRISSADGSESLVGMDQFLQIERAGRQAEAAGRFVASLVGGDRLTGEPVGMQGPADTSAGPGEQVVWNSPSLGQLSLPLERLASITRAGATPQRAAPAPTEDTVLLANGDRVGGVLSAVEKGGLTIQAANGPVTVPVDAVMAVELAAVASPDAGGRSGFRVRLGDGSSVTVDQVAISGPQARLTLPGGKEQDVPIDQLVGVEQVNGPVQWLSSLEPAVNEQVPFLGPSWPARMDRSVTGEPIRFEDRTFARGIGVHSLSRLSYELDGGHAAFRTQYAIDGPWPYADVTVRIMLDDQTVHEKTGFRAGELHPVVLVPLKDAKRITLEVDYGEAYDVQDRFNWIEPALLRQMPTTQPTNVR